MRITGFRNGENVTRFSAAFVTLLFITLTYSSASAYVFEEKPIGPRIRDNSFWVEEAYNQEAGVVHHIQYFTYNSMRSWAYTFTQEWPADSPRFFGPHERSLKQRA